MTIVRRILASSRFFIVIAVLSSFVASTAAMVYGGLATVNIVWTTFRDTDFSEKGAKLLSVGLITMVDLFLLGTVLYIATVLLFAVLAHYLSRIGWATVRDDARHPLRTFRLMLSEPRPGSLPA